MRIAGRVVYTVFIALTTFVNVNAWSGPLESRTLIRLTLLLYAIVFFGLFWMLEDRRRAYILRDIEEVIQRDSSMQEDGGEYIRHRYQASSILWSRLLSMEPVFWLMLTVIAIAFQFVSSKHLS
jgi:hypothetical protein